MQEVILNGLYETLYMVIVSTVFAVILGIIPAMLLTITANDGLKPNKIVYGILDFIVNILRSIPFIVLMVLIMPLTRLIVGKAIGLQAAIVPLAIASAPFVARIIENALREVDPGVIEAARSFGASDTQIIFKVMLKEAVPAIVSGITLTIISVIGYSAITGALGSGGLGHVAVAYGHERNMQDYLWVTVLILIVLVQGIQMIGNLVYKKLSK